MNIKRYITKARKVRKARKTYKALVFKSLLVLVLFFLFVLCGYTYQNYIRKIEENAGKEAAACANRLVVQIDERLNNLREYYVSTAESDEVKWMLENEVKYSDYSYYKAAYDAMYCRKIFTDYIGSFTFVNFKTGWVLSNKGLFPFSEAYNGDMLVSLYDQNKNGMERGYWSYDKGISIENSVDRKYRVTIETDGLNFIMRLPWNSYNDYAFFVGNINMGTWKRWINDSISPREEALVLDAQGNLIYATDEAYYTELQGYHLEGVKQGKLTNEKKEFVFSKEPSSVLNWSYYVIHEISEGEGSNQFPFLFLVIILLIAIMCYIGISYFIYAPVRRLLQNVSEGDEIPKTIEGNELEYLAGSYQDLKSDKDALENLLAQQQDKLEELFQLRLLHGEVDEEEWNEYLEGFGLRSFRCFATVVVILNLQGDAIQSMVNEDAICLKILQEIPQTTKKLAWMPPIYNASTIFGIFAEENENELLERINTFYLDLQQCTELVSGYTIQMGVSATHTNFRHIRAAYRESISALTFKAYKGSGTTEAAKKQESIENCHFYLGSSTVSGKYNHRFEDDIRAAIKAVDRKLCYQVTDQFCHYLAEEKRSEDDRMIQITLYINTILVTAIEAGINLEKVFPGRIKGAYMDLFGILEIERVRRYLKQRFIDPIIESRQEFLDKHSDSILEKIENLIAERKGNLSLTECADELGVHQACVWKVLKMERDRSFSDYVEEYKVNEAKRLLTDTEMTVAEIAEALCYTNAQNFIRFFSKCTGVTPGKFRKLI